MERTWSQLPSACRSANNADDLQRSFLDHLYCFQARSLATATDNDIYVALALTVRDRLMPRWVQTIAAHNNCRRLCYLSVEYLPGPHLRNALQSMDLDGAVRSALLELGLDLDEIASQEPEPGLGSGELGRLAACTLDALATLEIPTIAYGIRYEFGLFAQKFHRNRQVERSEKWLRGGNPWEIVRPELTCEVGFGGYTEHYKDATGAERIRWVPERFVKGMAYDTPIPGYKVATVNLLRLWSAEAYESFDVQAFNLGDYQRAVKQKIASESISKVLYLDDEPTQEQVPRFEQHYFLVACAVQDMVRTHLQNNADITKFAAAFAVQINDAHPALVVVELMRILVDQLLLGWDDAWAMVTSITSYTSHSLLPEVLERWPVELFDAILPRHLEIIYALNDNFLAQVRHKWPQDQTRVTSLSLIDERSGKRVRMAHLACVASQCMSGVADLNSQLPRDPVLRNFYALNPERFIKIANGVSHRRFLALANPALARLISDAIGTDWLKDLQLLHKLIPLAADASFRAAWREVKAINKNRLVAEIKIAGGIHLNPASLFDVQVKRIHEYKRQHLNILHVISRYFAFKHHPTVKISPRVWIYAGKAAPGSYLSQLIIELILGVARIINNDRAVAGLMCVAFLPNLGVKGAERLYPAADLSEQITTAGKESSAAGTIKFALNGALTIGNSDGANVEIQTAIGRENFFCFGMNETQVHKRRASGYRPQDHYAADPELRTALDAIAQGQFSGGDRNRFRPLLDALLNWDGPFVLADFASYSETQRVVDHAWANPEGWTRSSILNTAGCGNFSSDSAIADSCKRLWKIQPLQVQV